MIKEYDSLTDVILRDGDVLTMKDGKWIVRGKPISRAKLYGLLILGIFAAEMVALYFVGSDLESRVRTVCSYVGG